MRFKKGQIPWNKGIPCREETKKKISDSLKGQIPWIAGKHHTEETKRKMRGKRKPDVYCKNCGKVLVRRDRQYCSRRCFVIHRSKNGMWRGKNNPHYGVKRPKEVVDKVQASRRKTFVKKTLLRGYNLKYVESSEEHDQEIINQIEELKKQGFECFSPEKIRPDIIARKDNQIYAIEVEYSSSADYQKYKGIKFFDDIIWVKVVKKIVSQETKSN